MTESISDVQHRIASTKNTRQITTAMQMVQTSKLNQIQKAAVGYQEYVKKIKSVMLHLAKSHLLDGSLSDLTSDKESKKVAYLVITSDRGMVGSYNSNVIRGANSFIEEHSNNREYVILAIGGTGANFYKKRGANVIYEYRGMSDIPTFKEVSVIVQTITNMYDNHIFTELYLLYDHFVNRLINRFSTKKMLPVDSETLSIDSYEETEETLTGSYDMEPSEKEVLNMVLPQYSESLIFGAVLDAKTSEHASSSNAMKIASDNATDLIAKLKLQYNRARQAAITTEITEITGGQEALNN